MSVPYQRWWRQTGIYFSENDALHVGLFAFPIILRDAAASPPDKKKMKI